MAGRSGKPVVQKLGLKPGFCIFVDGLSAPYDDVVGELPADVLVAKTARAPLDAVHLFAAKAEGLAAKLRCYRQAIAPDGMIWVSWPKASLGVATDLTERQVRETGLANGLVDVKVCAVDDVWSGLKFVIPVKDRGKR
ncbi:MULTISPECIES: DUF3052 family protein [Bradyrhizobium]|jgi:hypothetical protein|uniref:DUF3052 domain-containing protein n=1 Tax=Bradyrhizobium elkanii TaxID=29448 RepID=A0A8I1Y7Q4_BRAEL|nr:MULTISPECIES: DUF3052 family protein [Bradyrhizobium]MBP1293820.1 hypothetical protein [Bradyrhizobium elkanii]MCP1925596.1 hypothetical protein [Bradyrhizobium elkanii]MCS3476912.1 hypothetical protein [Bradyrhizobium elkanii]MCS3583650.1 hypothetical protein [Bradyrhizobium elkanii]MCS3717220.1 hypothetical protein [Bradyrhizobium elkanii]